MPRRARCSGASTTRCGARPRTTRCGCCALIPRDKLEAAAADPEFLALYDQRDRGARRRARGAQHVVDEHGSRSCAARSIAYFSAEFALHQSLPIYAGGLGVLAGDHCKEAGDLGVPLIGVGFMYPQGYFHQHISAEGWQEESYERLNWADAPIEPATDAATASRASPRCRSAIARCWSRSGACASAA